jgi:hypothetical protein
MWGEKNMPAIDAPIRRIDQISSPVAEMPRISAPAGEARNAQ